jgi:hypothetical protein
MSELEYNYELKLWLIPRKLFSGEEGMLRFSSKYMAHEFVYKWLETH